MPNSPEQVRSALARADDVRLARSRVKRAIRRGELSAADVLEGEPGADLLGMRIWDLLRAQHRWGAVRASRLMESLGIPEGKTVGAATPRQRAKLARAVRTTYYDAATRAAGRLTRERD